nr:hypothetical protein [Rhizobium leguminosarum]
MADGLFRGAAVFRAKEPGEEKPAEPEPARRDAAYTQAGVFENEAEFAAPAEAAAADANKAGIRIDLLGIGGNP